MRTYTLAIADDVLFVCLPAGADIQGAIRIDGSDGVQGAPDDPDSEKFDTMLHYPRAHGWSTTARCGVPNTFGGGRVHR